jgi:guanosine-3',5'-bis(diphosphate) 3'-pyrophosphohydrolase
MDEATLRHTMTAAQAWQQAAALAARLHQGQFRKDGLTPYVAHVYRVTLTVSHLFACTDPTALTAALLHDTIEDTTGDYEDVEEQFGSQVADIVAALSKDMRRPEPIREVEYDAGLEQAPWQAKLIKLADTYDNYCDQAYATQEPVSLDKAIARMQRALAIAGDDPRLSRGVQIVRAAISEAKARTT